MVSYDVIAIGIFLLTSTATTAFFIGNLSARISSLKEWVANLDNYIHKRDESKDSIKG